MKKLISKNIYITLVIIIILISFLYIYFNSYEEIVDETDSLEVSSISGNKANSEKDSSQINDKKDPSKIIKSNTIKQEENTKSEESIKTMPLKELLRLAEKDRKECLRLLENIPVPSLESEDAKQPPLYSIEKIKDVIKSLKKTDCSSRYFDELSKRVMYSFSEYDDPFEWLEYSKVISRLKEHSIMYKLHLSLYNSIESTDLAKSDLTEVINFSVDALHDYSNHPMLLVEIGVVATILESLKDHASYPEDLNAFIDDFLTALDKAGGKIIDRKKELGNEGVDPSSSPELIEKVKENLEYEFSEYEKLRYDYIIPILEEITEIEN